MAKRWRSACPGAFDQVGAVALTDVIHPNLNRDVTSPKISRRIDYGKAVAITDMNANFAVVGAPSFLPYGNDDWLDGVGAAALFRFGEAPTTHVL